jgi:uncharacterized protein YdeI (BOF family)
MTALASGLVLGGNAIAGNPDPYAQADSAWISIGGTVQEVGPDSFILDYGDGLVKVEMDDGDRDADGYKLVTGDSVSVSGAVDDDFFEMTTIEASSVYVRNIGTTFFASSMDEEYIETFDPSMVYPLTNSNVVISGTVREVKGSELLLDTGEKLLRVETATLPYDPLDDEGYLKVTSGDRIRVVGHIDTDLFDGRELEADSIVKLHKS